jgi:ABC-type branched-subunit amino acid transport system permease subunit
VIMVVLGGMRSFWGPLVGAAVFVFLQDYLSSLTTNWMSFLGAIFVVMVLFFPRGVLGLNWPETFRAVQGFLRRRAAPDNGSRP